MRKILLLIVCIFILISFVRAESIYNESCKGTCFECGCQEGYFCEPENRTCVRSNTYGVSFDYEQNLTEEETQVLEGILKPFGGFEQVKEIPLALLKTNGLVVKLSGVSFNIGLDWLGKPEIQVLESNELNQKI